jgi:hypothetical protein
MAKKDKAISALEVIHAALKPLKAEERKRVLASVNALLQISPSSGVHDGKAAASSGVELSVASSPNSPTVPRETGTRPVAIRELIQDKGARTHPELITLFAYFREKYQSLTKFSREDLKQYYQMSREHPPRNYDRDFVEVVRRGWIHEDDGNSYITSKGIEAVESGFSARESRSKLAKIVRKAKKKTARR